MNTDKKQTAEYAKECLEFIGKSVSCYHAVANIEELLQKAVLKN